MQFPKVTSVKPVEKYKLQLQFDDGTEGVYDVSHLAGKGVFKAWDSENIFGEVFISTESGAITWPGELDIDTLNVYCNIKGISVDEYLTPKKSYASH
jgi:hypothetical protein